MVKFTEKLPTISIENVKIHNARGKNYLQKSISHGDFCLSLSVVWIEVLFSVIVVQIDKIEWKVYKHVVYFVRKLFSVSQEIQ